jgi:hypothetical protein
MGRLACAVVLVIFSIPKLLLADEIAHPVILDVAGPLVVGFFPPVTDAELESGDGTSEGVAHLQFSLEDAAQCLQDKGVAVRLEFTRAFFVRTGGKEQTIQIPRDWEHAVGAILARPGVQPRVVYATAGPSSLSFLLPEATAEYFGAPACKESGDSAAAQQDVAD